MNTDSVSASWHCLDGDDALARLNSDRERGLSQAEAAARLDRHGENEIALEEGRRLLSIIASQLTDLMIIVLLVAALIAGLLGELRDSIAIIIIVVLNGIIGASQEFRAQRAIAALRKISAHEARVIRDGATRNTPATDLVPGDIIFIAAGDIVPADVRLLESQDLTTDESSLTGESLPVAKQIAKLIDQDSPLGDRSNLSYKSTAVTKGSGVGLVVATGANTEIGHIADLLAEKKRHGTPLQLRLAAFGRRLAVVILAICAVIFALGIVNGQAPMLMFLTAVSLAVAAIPEALPAVVTVSLALGAKKLSRQNCLVRRLPAVETLGSITFICADKTGTLTENRMSLAAIHAENQTTASLAELADSIREQLGVALAVCNDLGETAKTSDDPTEVALQRAAAEAGFVKADLLNKMPQLTACAFDTERKRMTTVHRVDDGAVIFTKGAPEEVLAICTTVLRADGSVGALPSENLVAATTTLAHSGHRVLAVATRRCEKVPTELTPETVERELTLIGLVGLSDPVRPEVPQAIDHCLSAGITPIMITGDHPDTALHIGEGLGLVHSSTAVLTGRELALLSDDELVARIRDVRIYARVDPEQKIRIVETLQKSGEFVAMTGDGVNDAPALKQASIGVAMGKRGTDVAREAADMVLLDDNFATIVGAVREGRRIYDNIRKFIRYTLTSNSGEIWVLLLAPFLGLPVPLVPIQILWVNLVTDGLPGLAFSAEPAEHGVMQRPPRPPQESVFAHGMWLHIAWVGLLIGGLSLGTSFWADGQSVPYWQTMVFTTLVIAQLSQALAVRSEFRISAHNWRFL